MQDVDLDDLVMEVVVVEVVVLLVVVSAPTSQDDTWRADDERVFLGKAQEKR